MLTKLRSIFARQVEPPTNMPAVSRFGFLFGGSDAGAYVSADSALTIVTVWACTNLIARNISMLPWQIYAASADPRDGNVPLPNHQVGWLLDKEPNAEMTASRFRQALLTGLLLHGNGIAEIERDGAGRPISLWPIDSRRVEPWRDNTGRLFYMVNNGTNGRIPASA
jgi:HK97 family phage portal protein